MGMIGKRKGSAAKGAGGVGTNNVNKIGGSLSKNDHWYLQQAFGMSYDPGLVPSGHTATGGIISDYTDPTGDIYRAHVFNASGEFVISTLSDLYPATIEYLVVAGGGGGGCGYNPGGSPYGVGGGGAGGLRTNLPGVVDGPPAGPNPAVTSPDPFPVAATTYPVVIGGGGRGGDVAISSSDPGYSGSASALSQPGPTAAINCDGGGGGGGNSGPTYAEASGAQGGSGGGGNAGPGTDPGAAGAGPGGGSGNVDPYTPPQGNPGGTGSSSSPWPGGGGGGRGTAGWPGHASGSSGSGSEAGQGGFGVQVFIAGPPTAQGAGVAAPPGNGIGWFAGGGGGGRADSFGGWGGGGNGEGDPNSRPYLVDGVANTGGGGGGCWGPALTNAGNGGSGCVIVRYQIGESQTNTAKASGGSISFYGGKTIHTFTTSGSLVAPTIISDAEFVIVGGGGAGGEPQGGGGGAGSVVIHDGPFSITAATHPVVIGGGAGGTARQGSSTTLQWASAPTDYGATGGGGGGYPTGANGGSAPVYDGGDGGSGGGGSNPGGVAGSVSNPFPNPGATEYGNAGGAHGGGSNGGGGGGAGPADANTGPDTPAQGGNNGGIGAPGGAAPSPTPAPIRSWGGSGKQLPATYRDPKGFFADTDPGSPTSHYWVGGGGAGYFDLGPTYMGVQNPVRGGGGGAHDPSSVPLPNTTAFQAASGQAGTGGGGCGPYRSTPTSTMKWVGQGGSGLVLIAYPT